MKYRSRKFLLTVGTILLSTGLLCAGKVTESAWSMVILACLGGYYTANVSQKYAEK